MGSWDYYCALCGSTFFVSNIISRKPRTAHFNRKRRESKARKAAKVAREQEKKAHEGAGIHYYDVIHDPDPLSSDSETYERSDEEDDSDSLDSYTEEHSYDPEIITEDAATWATILQCIGFNPDAPGLSKAYISGLGTAEDYGGINVEPGDDPNYPESPEASCYLDYNGLDPIFPFHVTCFQLFKQQLSHQIEETHRSQAKIHTVKDVNHDVLYNVMNQLGQGGSSCLGINYGSPTPPDEQFWLAMPGEELFIANPLERNDLVMAFTLDAWEHCNQPISARVQGQQGERDLFSMLPMELLLKVTEALQPMDLLKLIIGSKHVYDITTGIDSNGFWLQHFKTMMPWFFELNEFLEDAQREGRLNHSLYHLFVWADKISAPRVGKKGPFMGVANRRRIWGVCQQISEAYIARAKQEELFDEGLALNPLHSRSTCDTMPAVSFPDKGDTRTQTTFWVEDVANLDNTQVSSTLQLFWSEEEALVGLAFKCDEADSALFGYNDSYDGVVAAKDSLNLERGDWVKGFILYYPEVNHMDLVYPAGWWMTAKLNTAILGIEILLESGGSAKFGNVSPQLVKRPLLARQGRSIVGLMGNIGTVKLFSTVTPYPDPIPGHKDVYRILRLGLVQYPPDEGMMDQNEWKQLAESLAWGDDCSKLLAKSTPDLPRHSGGVQVASPTRTIWDLHGLRLIYCGDYQISFSFPDDLVAHYPLIWAINANERRSLVRMIVYMKYDGMISGWDQDHKPFSRPCPAIVGMRVEYSAASGLEPRQVGVASSDNEPHIDATSCRWFDIDGPGGEEISSVAIAIQGNENPKAVKVRTNRDRVMYWGEKNWNHERRGDEERPSREFIIPHDMHLIGAAVSFSSAGGYDHETKTHGFSKLSSFSCLVLPSHTV